MYKLINIVICYGNEDEVIAYSKEIKRQTISDLIKMVIVVNKENKGITYLVSSLNNVSIDYQIIKVNSNLGYLNGLVYGFKRCNCSAEWYIFSNTDIEIPDENFMKDFLHNKIIKQENIWLIGPSVYSTKRMINSNPYLVCRPSKLSYIIRNAGMYFPYLYHLMFELKRYLLKSRKEIKCQSCKTYAVHGSYMFLKEQLLQKISLQSKWELLYDEEQYIAEVVRKNKKFTVYVSELCVNHVEGTSTGKVALKKRYKAMIRSNKRILKEFY